MKRFLMYTLFALCLGTTGLLSSCKEEDDPNELIVGTWKNDLDQTIIFYKGGTLSQSDVSGTWSIAGNTLTIIYYQQTPITYTIVSISETNMVWRYSNVPETISYTKQ